MPSPLTPPAGATREYGSDPAPDAGFDPASLPANPIPLHLAYQACEAIARGTAHEGGVPGASLPSFRPPTLRRD